MSRDEHGMPLPGDVLTKADFDFCSHAFRWIVPCRDIVRRLAEWAESDLMGDFDKIASDAVVLWAEMLKGAGDE